MTLRRLSAHAFVRVVFAIMAASLTLSGCGGKTQSPTSPTAPPPTAPAPAPAPGTTMHSTLHPSGSVLSNDMVSSERSGSGYDRQIYDDFRLASTATIRTIAWQGIHPTTIAPTGYYLSFIPDSGNQSPVMQPDETFRPRPLWSATYTPGQVNERLDVTKACENSPQQQCGMYNYTVTLTTPFTAAGGTRYWIMIQAESPGNAFSAWAWRKGTPDNGFALSNIASTTFPWDMAFALRP